MRKMPLKLRFAVLATDTVLLAPRDGALFVLLIPVRRLPHFSCHWGAPGGLIHPRETADQAALRHLKEKAGIANMYAEQLYTFSGIHRDPRGRVVSVAYLALAPETVFSRPLRHGARWFPVKSLPRLAYDHKEIIAKALRRVRAKIGYTNIAYALLSAVFTLGELQTLYETILGKKFDKRNFRKKFFALKLLHPTGKKRILGRSRPAMLYRFADRRLRFIEIL